MLNRRALSSSWGVDGASFMCYEDWANYFTNVSVCPIGTAPIPADEGDLEEGSCDEEEAEPLEDDWDDWGP